MCTLHEFSVLKSNLFIRALLLDRILVTEKTTRTPRVHLVPTESLSSSIHVHHFLHETCKKYLIAPTNIRMEFKVLTEEEILNIINSLDNKSNSGCGGLSNTMVKSLKNELYMPLTLIINQMLHTGKYPNAFKIAKVIPIFKMGDPSLLTNYRPISLLPTLSTLFGRVIFIQLYYFFTTNKILCEQQYGFRAGHSTELAATELIDHMYEQIDQQKTPVHIYINLAKAFDTLNFDILLSEFKMLWIVRNSSKTHYQLFNKS